MRIAMLALVALTAAAPASAQREAISSALSPEAAAAAFTDAVVNVCVPAAVGAGVGALPAETRSRLQATTDSETRRQAGAAADETVWDVLSAKGVVTIHGKQGRCMVSVYGPSATQTVMGLAGRLTALPKPFMRTVTPSKSGMKQKGERLARFDNDKAAMVIVELVGSEPGTPGHQSRFSVVTATVSVEKTG
ncbi:MAG: hypothetical protein Q8R02_19555 [Hyphomonadaceae bacterium]|nr:hypothetical protein [Hyphomonadaceae bacterium]